MYTRESLAGGASIQAVRRSYTHKAESGLRYFIWVEEYSGWWNSGLSGGREAAMSLPLNHNTGSSIDRSVQFNASLPIQDE